VTAPLLDLRLIPLSNIDEPSLAMRETMPEDTLRELADSIKAIGLQQPICVRPRGARFEIVYGHRRYMACGRAGVFEVPCIVRDVEDRDAERAKIAENTDREIVNVVEEAAYFAELLTRYCHDDVDELCEFTKRPRGYVESRLLLLRGHPEVLEALRAGEINLGVATELNRSPDRTCMLMHIDPARGGATVRQVRQWITDYKNFRARQDAGADASPVAPTTSAPAPEPPRPTCVCCRENVDPSALIVVYVHEYCKKATLDKILRALHGDAAAASS
jgi:ParB/RepB/Spo0J family partition protein